MLFFFPTVDMYYLFLKMRFNKIILTEDISFVLTDLIKIAAVALATKMHGSHENLGFEDLHIFKVEWCLFPSLNSTVNCCF